MSSRRQDMSSRHIHDISSRRLQDRSSRRHQDMSSRHLQDVFSVTIYRFSRRLARCLKDVMQDVFKISSRRLQDVSRRLGRRKVFTLKT